MKQPDKKEKIDIVRQKKQSFLRKQNILAGIFNKFDIKFGIMTVNNQCKNYTIFGLPILFLFLLPSIIYAATDTLQYIKTIPIHANNITIDEQSNIYVVRNDNCLLRYNANGDSTGFYKSILNGEIGNVDATNPLRILLYYPIYSKAVVLDRMLSLKNELDLPQANIARPAAIASSADGNIWVYDQFNAKLKKIDDQLAIVNESNDLRQELHDTPFPVYMTERERKLYLCDTSRGIFIFDQYANFVNMLSIPGISRLQVFGDQLIYLSGGTLISYNIKSIETRSIVIDSLRAPMQAVISEEKVYALFPEGMRIYKMPSK